MAQAKVGIRLGTEGKSEVKRDFQEVGAAGDAAANRATRAFERASQDIESAQRRQAAAAAKIAAITPQTATQARINMAVGTGASVDEGSARVSAAAFRELIAEQEAMERKALSIRAALDPLWAAQQRVNGQMAEAARLHREGHLSADLYAQAQDRLQAELDQTAASIARNAQAQRDANQNKVNALLGVGTSSAIDNGAGYGALAAEMERMEQKAHALRAAIDPVWAAQQRFNTEMAEARTLISAGAITLDDYCAKLRIEQNLLNQVSGGHTGGAASAGQYRAGVQQLGFQFQDLGVQMAMAAGSGNVVKGVMTGLAMQGPQVVSAIALMRGSAGGFIGYLAGPWGAAILAATSVLAVLGAEFLGSGDDAAKAANKVDQYTSALNRLAGAQGRVTAGDLGMGKVRVEQLRGQLTTLDQQIAVTTGTRALQQQRARLLVERAALVNELSSAQATVAGSQIAWDNSQKLAALGAQDKADKGSASASARAERAGATAARREQATATREAAQAERELLTDMVALEKRFDPAAASARVYREELEKIAALTGAGKITGEQAADWKANLRAQNFLPNLKGQLQPDVAVDEKRGDDEGRRRETVAQMLADLEQQNIYLDAERGLIRASNDNRDLAIAKLRIVADLKREGVDLETSDARAIIEAAEATEVKRQAVARMAQEWAEVQRIGEAALDRLFDPTSAESWGDRIKGVLQDILNEMFVMAALNPLKNMLFNSGLPTMGGGGGGLLGGLFKAAIGAVSGGGHDFVPVGSAIGHDYTPAGAMLVGENGPEIVNMPRGARVMTASDTRRAMGGGMSVHAPMSFNIDATGADAAGLARVEAQLAQLRSELPGTIVSTVSEAQSRLMLRGGGGF